MIRKLKNTYKFAAISTVYITLFSTALIGILMQFLAEFSWQICFYFASIMAVFSFLSVQYRVERYIYSKVKKIYSDVSLLESSTFTTQSVTTDMASLTQEVKEFATSKKLEIETLKVREAYRREFLGNVSHELKTPLFTVQGYLSTLLDGAMNDKSIRKKYISRAEKGVERLILIVQDLDMIAKLETGNLNLKMENFNIVEVIQNVFDLLEMNASEKDIMLLFDQKYTRPIMVYGDGEKIHRAVVNLIVNTIKYGKEKGSTEVSIEELTKDKIIVRVRDNGDGVSVENISRIFERFYRVDKSGSRDVGGSGLGLSIVKHIIEGHGEKIYIESQLNKGSEFSFTLKKAK